MTCKETQDLLSAYLDRQLTPADLSDVRLHLETCAACRAEEHSLLQLKEALRNRARCRAMPADLVAAIEAETIFKPRWWELPAFQRWAPALMGLAIGLGAFFFCATPGRRCAQARRRSPPVPQFRPPRSSPCTATRNRTRPKSFTETKQKRVIPTAGGVRPRNERRNAVNVKSREEMWMIAGFSLMLLVGCTTESPTSAAKSQSSPLSMTSPTDQEGRLRAGTFG